jgi:hypothetical protein
MTEVGSARRDCGNEGRGAQLCDVAGLQTYTIAAFTNELIGNRPKTDVYVSHIRAASPGCKKPGYKKNDVLRSFAFRDREAACVVELSLARLLTTGVTLHGD